MSTYFGFVILAKLKDKAWIAAYNMDGTVKWIKILHDNGPSPKSVKS